jgi:hypothetical protein
MAYALGTWVLQNNIWYNTTTGSTLYLGVGTYPPGVSTFTPTASATPSSTPTNTFTPNPNVILIGKSLGAGTAVTPTPTIVSNVLTVYHASHGYSQGDALVLAGATASATPEAGINAMVTITGVTTNTYTIPVAGTGAVAGTLKEIFWFSGANSLNVSKISNITRASAGTYTVVLTNTQPNGFYGPLSWIGYVSGTNLISYSNNAVVPSTTQFGIIFATTSTGIDPTGYLGISIGGIN